MMSHQVGTEGVTIEDLFRDNVVLRSKLSRMNVLCRSIRNEFPASFACSEDDSMSSSSSETFSFREESMCKMAGALREMERVCKSHLSLSHAQFHPLTDPSGYSEVDTTNEVDTTKEVDETSFVCEWQRGNVIGRGAYGTVYLGLDVKSGQLLAVKCVELPDHSRDVSDELDGIRKEISLLRHLCHPNIVRYMGSESKTLKDGSREFNIFLEYVPGGSISLLLSRFGSFDERVVRRYALQILNGLAYLHTNRIIHRDVKGANILIDHCGNVKLADFGCSKKVENVLTPRGGDGDASIRGTAYWMAPEVIKGQGHRSASDIWSVGCVVVEMASGKPPFCDIAPEIAAMYHIATTKDMPRFPEGLSHDACDFLSRCFAREPRHRPTAVELLNHKWLSGVPPPPAQLAMRGTPAFGEEVTHGRETYGSALKAANIPLSVIQIAKALMSAILPGHRSNAPFPPGEREHEAVSIHPPVPIGKDSAKKILPPIEDFQSGTFRSTRTAVDEFFLSIPTGANI